MSVPVLHVCSWADGGPPGHGCAKAIKALQEAGVEHRVVVAAPNRTKSLMRVKGRRPDLKALSGQELLPVLQLSGRPTINGTKPIVAWAQEKA